MLVTPLPGANRGDILTTFRMLQGQAADAGNTHGGAYKRLMAYLDWATTCERMLQARLTRDDIDRLILTRGYERLLAAAGSLTGDDTGTQRVLNNMITEELQQRHQAFEEAIKDLGDQRIRWAGMAVLTVPDTSVYIQHENKLRDIDFAFLLTGSADKTVRVIVPMVILDELDSLKRSGDPRLRWRAGHTLAVMEEAFATEPVPGLLRPFQPDYTRGVILDVLFDPPRHVRLPINDDEIIDRALTAQALAAKPVTLLTYDTSQAQRARHAGLPVRKLTQPIGDEPPEPKKKTERQQRPSQAGAPASAKRGEDERSGSAPLASP